jgi:putative zinc finger/helix-turn-helix YgiT family protein
MNDPGTAQRQTRCPVCGNAYLQPQIRTEQFDYEVDEGKYSVIAENVPSRVCPACGERFSGPDAGRIRDDAIRRALGVLMPDEIRTLRSQLGLSITEFGQLTGIGEIELVQWESGQMIQSRANDHYLRLLAANPENVKVLAAKRNGQCPQRQETQTADIS